MMLKISKTIQIIQLLALSIIKAYIVDLFSKNSYRLLPADIFCKKQEIVLSYMLDRFLITPRASTWVTATVYIIQTI